MRSPDGTTALRPIGVTIVSPRPRDRAGLAAVLGCEPDLEVLGAASDRFAAVALARRVEPDVVVLDQLAVRPAAVETARMLAGLHRAPAVVVVAAELPSELVTDALRAGAAAICAREQSPAALAGAVRAVAAGHAVLEQAVLRQLLGAVPPRITALGECTPREREVLELVAQGRTNPEICERLVITDATVRTHIASLRRKLRARTRAELVSRAYARLDDVA